MAGGVFGYPEKQMPHGGRLRLAKGLRQHEGWADAIMPGDNEAGRIESETNRRPLLALAGLTALAMLVLGVRLFALQIAGGSRNLGLAEGNRIRQKVVRAPRGVVYDRNKKVLVQNQASFDLTVTPAMLPANQADRQALYTRVAGLAGLNAADIARQAEAKGLNAAQPVLLVSGLARDKALSVDQYSTELTGFSLDVNPIRDYLDNGLLSHLLGYTGRISPDELANNRDYQTTDYIGKLGLEQSYENILRGTAGKEQTEVDAAGRPIKVLASQAAVPGQDLELSIDWDLQQHLAAAIQKQMQAAGATQAAGVALDPRTGEVLAAVSLPTYDNNLFSRGISQADYQRLAGDKAQPLFNKAFSGAFPSGSIIKPLVASAALQERVVTPDTTIVDQGSLTVVNKYNTAIKYVFNGWEHSGLGVMNIYRAIAMSSDIYFYTVAGGFGPFQGLGIEKLDAYYQKFGLGAKTGIDVPGETAGRVPTPDWKQKVSGEPWYTGDTYNISVGQGDILVSPLQIALATAAIANGGTLYKPHVVKDVLDGNGNVSQQIQPEALRKNFISPQNLDIVRQGMRQTVASGTACCVMDKEVPVQVAGKTGTAETDPGSNRKPHAWFTSFAPYDNPRIVTAVLIENSGEGAEYAVPATRETLAWYFSSGH